MEDRRVSEGSWVLLHEDNPEVIEEGKQVHITLFDRVDGPGREIYAHYEDDWRSAPLAHLRSANFDVRVQLLFEEFDERYDRFPKSKATLNRRVKRVSEVSEVESNIYPHSLRATAAMLHASRDLSPYALMSTMGWETLETARSYLGSSDTSAARELRYKYR